MGEHNNKKLNIIGELIMKITKTKIAILGASLITLGSIGATSVYANNISQNQNRPQSQMNIPIENLEEMIQSRQGEIIAFLKQNSSDLPLENRLNEENIAHLQFIFSELGQERIKEMIDTLQLDEEINLEAFFANLNQTGNDDENGNEHMPKIFKMMQENRMNQLDKALEDGHLSQEKYNTIHSKIENRQHIIRDFFHNNNNH